MRGYIYYVQWCYKVHAAASCSRPAIATSTSGTDGTAQQRFHLSVLNLMLLERRDVE